METKQVTEVIKELGENFSQFKENQEDRMTKLETVMARKAKGSVPELTDSEGAETKAVRQWLNGKGMDTKTLSVADDGQGVTVRSDWSDRIFEKIRETTPVRQVANVMSTDSNELEVLVDRGEPGSAWVAESDNRAQTDASFLSRHKIAVFEHYAYPAITQQFIEDSQIDLEQWLTEKISRRFSRQENEGFITGDGDGKPRGMLDYGTIPNGDFEWGNDPAAYQIGAIYTGTAGDFPADDPDNVLYDVVDGLKSDYQGNARWMMSRATMNKVRKLKDADGRALLQMSLADGRPDTILGFPVVIAEDMPDPADGSISMLFGNFSEAYTVIDRVGVSVLQDPGYTQPGFIKWYIRKRVGGAMTNPEAVKAVVFGAEPA